MAHHDEYLERLAQVRLFADLDRHELEAVSGLGTDVQVEAGRELVREGDPAAEAFLVLEGTASCRRGDEEIATFGPGDFFGEMALIDDAPRSATAITLEPSETWTLHREEFIQYLTDNPDFALHVLKTLARHIRRLNTQLADIFFLDLPGRLARVLLNLADQYGRRISDGTVIDLALTQTDLAEMTGATRVSVNKALGRFRRNGWLRVVGRQVTVLDRAALEGLIEVSGGEM